MMKKTFNLLLFSIAILITACAVYIFTPKAASVEVAALRDVTEPFLIQPKADEILRLYDFDKNKWNGGVFRYSEITQVSFNETEQVRIETENEWLSNRFRRDQKVKEFQKGVEDILTNAEQTKVGRNNSSVYFTIAAKLNELSQSKADKKYLLVFSDLIENEPGLSFYRKSSLSELSNDSGSLKTVLENQMKLPSLQRITVYLLYEPADPMKDEQYKIVSKFYKELFESKGARVEITPNITI
jgi:hypothetical protein